MLFKKDKPKHHLDTGYINSDDTIPLPEYPRPQLERRFPFLNLNGRWSYKILDNNKNNAIVDLGEIVVPFPPESKASGVCRITQPNEIFIYKRKFNVPSNFFSIDSDPNNSNDNNNDDNNLKGKRILLNIGACDYFAKIIINKSECFDGVIGYFPLQIDITDKIKRTDINKIKISVRDPTDTGFQPVGKQTLKPEGIFYTPCSGLWQTVWLECVPQSGYIKCVKIKPKILANSCVLEIDFKGDQEALPEIKVFERVDSETEENGEPVSFKQGLITRPHLFSSLNDNDEIDENENLDENGNVKKKVYELRFCKTLTYWTPENPKLYNMDISIGEDKVKTYFGMREFGVNLQTKRVTLNGRTCFLSGVLDQGYWPESNLCPPSDRAIVGDIMYAKRSGFNMIRKHIKIEPLRFYYHCDRLGMIVVQDMVNGAAPYSKMMTAYMPFIGLASIDDTNYMLFNRKDEKSRKEFEEFIVKTVDHLFNTVSIGVWTLFNEGWGQFDSVRLTKLLKEKDPTRPIDSTSGWHDQGCGDFTSLHVYFKKVVIPKKKKNIHANIKLHININDDPDESLSTSSTFDINLNNPPSPGGTKKGSQGSKRALFLSEFGGYSLKTEEHMYCPENSFGYKEFKNKEELEKGIKKLYMEEVMPNIENGLCAVVYTQLTDVETEVNGLLTYDRKVMKIQPDFMLDINEALYSIGNQY